MKHKGKVALVTGAARGIGWACTKRLLAEGAQVVLLDVDEERTREAAEEFGAEAMVLAADLSTLTSEGAGRLVAEAVARFGGLDILVNNAGVIHLADFLDFPADCFDWVMNVNVRAPMLLSQAAAKAMIAGRRSGAIVNISSVTAQLAAIEGAAYCASKGAIMQLTKVMALALIRHGIRVNAVGPGTISTEMSQDAVQGSDALRRTVLSRTPIGRFGEPDEIAKVVSFLASDDASYVVGQTVYTDGGRLILNYTMSAEAEGDKVKL